MEHLEFKRKPGGRLVGGWIDDFIQNKKAICLCSSCLPRFSAESNNYERVVRPPLGGGVNGKCDGCDNVELCIVYMPITGG